MKKKRLLMLGGSMQQIPAIIRAREMGHYVITCDYLPGNPGHKYAHEFYNISTTDKKGVLELAKKLRIEGIVAYASDPAAPTAAYVAEKMGLEGNPYESVKILTQKDLFRKFLKENGFHTPEAKGYSTYEEAATDTKCFKFPVMVKPVDSSGSKGVVKVNNVCGIKSAVEEALCYSPSKKFIIEEFIEKKGYQISGDGFSVDGKLVFTSYGNELYDEKGMRDYVALGEFWPSLLTEGQKKKVDNEIQRLLTALGMKTGAYNIEVILDKEDTPYILEMGPRNGGSYIPQLIEYATGVNLIDYTIKASLGESCEGLKMPSATGVWSNYMILSKETGLFKEIHFDEKFKKNNLLNVYSTATAGCEVHAYQNTTHSLGTILFKAQSVEEMIEITSNIEKYYKVILE